MTRTITDLGNGLQEIILDFSDETGTETSCSSVVAGDAHAYATVLEADFRKNNEALFPVPEPEILKMDMGGEA